MITPVNGREYECVLIDLNTQRDLCASQGAYPVVNHATLIPALRRVVAWVKRNHAPIISSIESHRRWELSDSHAPIGCCVDGTGGQRKIDFTIFPRCARIEVDNTLSIPIDLFRRYQQVIFRERGDDLLGNPKADRFLTQLRSREFILFGVGIECSVKALALGLLSRNKKVTVVVDACGYWNRATAELTLRQIAAKGTTLITVDQLRNRKLDRSHRYPITFTDAGRRKGNGRRTRCGPVDGSGRSRRNDRPASQRPRRSDGRGTDTDASRNGP